jgi:hypothetical protein
VKDGQPPVEASKAVKLSKLPPLLVVHMQRFAYDAAGTPLLSAILHILLSAVVRARGEGRAAACL